MAILFNKPMPAPEEQSHIYNSAEELAADPKFGTIKKYAPSGVTRCYGTILDAHGLCKAPEEEGLRSTFSKAFKTAPRIPGDPDNVVDAWDALNAAYNSDDLEVLYDRAVDPPEKLEALMKSGLPLNASLYTGDARDKGKGDIRTGRTESGRRSFVSGKDRNPNRVSRHAIINLGFTKNGKPIIYDLGKFSEGIPSKYKGEINSIIIPKGGSTKTYKQLAGVREEAPVPIESREGPKELPVKDVARVEPLPDYRPVAPIQYEKRDTGAFLEILKRALSNNFRNSIGIR